MAELNVERQRQMQTKSGLAPRTRSNWWSRWPTGFNPGFMAPNPFAATRRSMDEMDRSTGWMDWPGFMSQSGEGWYPSLEVVERDGNMLVKADLPGISQEDVKVEVNDGDLLIHGERRREHEETGKGFYRSERSYGSFSRCIPLPEGARTDQARAQFNNGVLEISIPVPETNLRSRTIPINAEQR